jgi:hypothetical protein
MEHALLRGTQGGGPARNRRISIKRKYTFTVSTCVAFSDMLGSEGSTNENLHPKKSDNCPRLFLNWQLECKEERLK